MKIAVIGASGQLGAPVARRLAADGKAVRLIGRNAEKLRARFGEGFEIAEADVLKPATLAAALQDCDGVHVNLRGTSVEDIERTEIAGARAIAEAIPQAGVKRVSYLSGAGLEEAPDLFPKRAKMAAEQALAGSGAQWISFRATHFMESLDSFIRGGSAMVPGKQPHRWHYLAAEDYAAMVSRAYDLQEGWSRPLTIFGPEAYTMEEALKIYARIVDPTLKVGSIPLWMPKVIGTLTGKRELSFVSELFRCFQLIEEKGDPEPANAMLGRPETTLEQWCRARAGGASQAA